MNVASDGKTLGESRISLIEFGLILIFLAVMVWQKIFLCVVNLEHVMRKWWTSSVFLQWSQFGDSDLLMECK
jgi:hypothetical protein